MTIFIEDEQSENMQKEAERLISEIANVKSITMSNRVYGRKLARVEDFDQNVILEMDDKNLIVKLQTAPVDDEFSKNALAYLAITNIIKENDKEMDLIVLSTVEESKTVEYKFGEDNVFTYSIKHIEDHEADWIQETF